MPRLPKCLSAWVPKCPIVQVPKGQMCPSALRVPEFLKSSSAQVPSVFSAWVHNCPSSARVPKCPSSALQVILDHPWRALGVFLVFPISLGVTNFFLSALWVKKACDIARYKLVNSFIEYLKTFQYLYFT